MYTTYWYAPCSNLGLRHPGCQLAPTQILSLCLKKDPRKSSAGPVWIKQFKLIWLHTNKHGVYRLYIYIYMKIYCNTYIYTYCLLPIACCLDVQPIESTSQICNNTVRHSMYRSYGMCGMYCAILYLQIIL